MERSSKTLHNFNFPQGLTWGKQQFLRCMKVEPVPAMHAVEDDESLDSGEGNQNPSAGQARSTDDRQKKFDFDLNSLPSPIKASSCPNEGKEKSTPVKYKSLKKLTSKASRLSPPPVIQSKYSAGGGINVEKKSMRPRRNLEKKEERPKFSIQLSRKEIEEDFIAMTGKKPPRKPNKPPKSVQLKLDSLSPGLWLSEVNPDRYKVTENGKI